MIKLGRGTEHSWPRPPLRYRMLNTWPPGRWPYGTVRRLDQDLQTGWYRSGFRFQKYFICASCGDAGPFYQRSKLRAELGRHTASASDGGRPCDTAYDRSLAQVDRWVDNEPPAGWDGWPAG
jgi:hypothetical protein